MKHRLFTIGILALYMINAFAIIITKPILPLIAELGCFNIFSFVVGGMLYDAIHRPTKECSPVNQEQAPPDPDN